MKTNTTSVISVRIRSVFIPIPRAGAPIGQGHVRSVPTTQEEGARSADKLIYLFYSFYHSKNQYHLNRVLFSRSNSVLIHSNYIRFLT
jgi:hypothetical protein